jgi:ribose/xylose/arabinose/galactoside ABC-type transport system permease subunit
MRALARLARHGLGLALVLLFGAFAGLEPTFLTLGNLSTLLNESAILAVLAVGATFGIISRNIDIAPASVIALSSVLVALVARASGDLALGLAAGVAGTLAIYLCHGLLIAHLGLDPLIVTLAAWIWARGLAVSLTAAATIPLRSAFVGTMNAAWVLGLAPPFFVAALVFGLGWVVLRRTRLGLYALALGQDERALRQSGVAPERAKVAVFALMGVTTSVGVILMLARIGAAAPTAGFGLELDAIVAVIIGGTSFKGGSGRIGDTLFGVAFIAVLDNGLSGLQMGDPEFFLLKGIAILAALLLEAFGRRIGAGRAAAAG